MTELTSLTLAQARDRLRKRKFSAAELAEAHLAAIEQARGLNSFVLEAPEVARNMAKAADRRLQAGDARPLEGIALGIKDLFATRDVRTTACSRILDGFEPTYGRCSRWGIVAYASSLDQAGPLARTVRDAAILLTSMAGHDPQDTTSADRPVPDYEAAVGRSVKGLRIGIPKEYRIEGIAPEIEKLWERGA